MLPWKENKSICSTFYQHLAGMQLHLFVTTLLLKEPPQDQWPYFMGITSFCVKMGGSELYESVLFSLYFCYLLAVKAVDYSLLLCCFDPFLFLIKHDCRVILIRMLNCVGEHYLPAASSYVLMCLYAAEYCATLPSCLSSRELPLKKLHKYTATISNSKSGSSVGSIFSCITFNPALSLPLS